MISRAVSSLQATGKQPFPRLWLVFSGTFSATGDDAFAEQFPHQASTPKSTQLHEMKAPKARNRG
jgi:hypothetical protein